MMKILKKIALVNMVVLSLWILSMAPAFALEWCLVHASSSQVIKCFKYKKVCDQIAKGYNGEAVCVAQ